MEMVLQQRAGPGSSGGGGSNAAGGCRAGPRAAAATAPMMAMAAAAKQEQEEQAGVDGGFVGADAELRRGPWTVDEDLTLINYIAEHGEGRWNALARAAGLKRTGKSCRLRWLNYLRPDVKRGDFTADEQLLILDLHSRWGNRWSKIAALLPGRTDNEIKNYWRTRVQKHAKQLNCDVNSKRFKDAMRFLWMPRLAERAAAQSAAGGDVSALATAATASQLETMSDDYCSPSSVVTTSSSCSRTSSESTATVNDDRAAVPPAASDWAMQQDQEFWSTASALQQLTTAGADYHQLFQLDMPPLQDLSGWVQGFSEAGVSPEAHLWSLDDIWRMQ